MSNHDHHHGSDLGTRRLGWAVAINVLLTAAQVVNAATAVLTYPMSKGIVDIKAALLHNVADALASVASSSPAP